MGKLDHAAAVVRERVGVGLPVPGERRIRDQIKGLLDLSYDDDPRVRQVAIRNLDICRIAAGEGNEVYDVTLEGLHP